MPYFFAHRHDVIFLHPQKGTHIVSEQRAPHLIARYVRAGLVPGVSVQERNRAGLTDDRYGRIFAVGLPIIQTALAESRYSGCGGGT